MRNHLFFADFCKDSGGIVRLSLVGDEANMNFCKNGRAFGTFKGFELDRFVETDNSALVLSKGKGLDVETSYCFEGDCLKVQHVIQNNSVGDLKFEEGEIALEMPLNDCYESSDICIKERCSAHIFTGIDSAYVRAERMGMSNYNLGIFFVEGQITSYSQEKSWHSNRGYFLLNLPSITLKKGESYALSYVFFPYKARGEFFEKLKDFDNYLRIDTECFTVTQGGKIEFCVYAKNVIQTATCECDGKNLDVTIDGNCMNVSAVAEKFGDNTVYFTVNGKKSYARFNVTLDTERLIENRLKFIVEKQQCLDKNSPLYGAFLIYDNEDLRQYCNLQWADHNPCRERFGMAILLVKWLQTHKNPEWEKRVNLFTEFLCREALEEKTGEVFDGIGKNQKYIRLYNAPWVALYFTELYKLTKEKYYALVVAKVLKYYYKAGGANFYPNGIRFYEFFQALKDAGMEKESKELLELFDEHVKNIVKNGVIYPPHEVKFEQTIVTPAATIMLDKYQLCGDEFYLREAEKHLQILHKFDGCQPDYHLHNIPIRFWDAYWFGKKQTYGDTFPHYWSVLSGYCYYLYGTLTENKEAVEIGRNNIKNCTCLFKENGEASCAYVYPFSVNGERGEYFDVFANDQDFALYFLLKLNK
jgi:hypothetical protein